jgi:hypothetical protein
MIELGLIAQASENDFGTQAGVPRGKLGRPGHQQIARISAVMHSVEHVERNLASRGYQLPFSNNCFIMIPCPLRKNFKKI